MIRSINKVNFTLRFCCSLKVNNNIKMCEEIAAGYKFHNDGTKLIITVNGISIHI